ncbi:MAG: hypothetical protein ACE5IH_08330 [Thermodesulfobacteriota bacterium]
MPRMISKMVNSSIFVTSIENIGPTEKEKGRYDPYDDLKNVPFALGKVINNYY